MLQLHAAPDPTNCKTEGVLPASTHTWNMPTPHIPMARQMHRRHSEYSQEDRQHQCPCPASPSGWAGWRSTSESIDRHTYEVDLSRGWSQSLSLPSSSPWFSSVVGFSSPKIYGTVKHLKEGLLKSYTTCWITGSLCWGCLVFCFFKDVCFGMVVVVFILVQFRFVLFCFSVIYVNCIFNSLDISFVFIYFSLHFALGRSSWFVCFAFCTGTTESQTHNFSCFTFNKIIIYDFLSYYVWTT